MLHVTSPLSIGSCFRPRIALHASSQPSSPSSSTSESARTSSSASSFYDSDVISMLFKAPLDPVNGLGSDSQIAPEADYFNAARESRSRRHLRSPSSASPSTPFPDAPSPSTKALFDLDDIHTEVNEEAKVAVRTYRSGVDCEVEAELRNEAQVRKKESKPLEHTARTANPPLTTHRVSSKMPARRARPRPSPRPPPRTPGV